MTTTKITELRQRLSEATLLRLRLVEALQIVSNILEFHEGSEEKLTERGEPVIWINASSPDGDFQTMLMAVRNALQGIN